MGGKPRFRRVFRVCFVPSFACRSIARGPARPRGTIPAVTRVKVRRLGSSVPPSPQPREVGTPSLRTLLSVGQACQAILPEGICNMEALSTVVVEAAAEYVGRWNRLVSTTNWEKGRIVSEWREALRTGRRPGRKLFRRSLEPPGGQRHSATRRPAAPRLRAVRRRA